MHPVGRCPQSHQSTAVSFPQSYPVGFVLIMVIFSLLCELLPFMFYWRSLRTNFTEQSLSLLFTIMFS